MEDPRLWVRVADGVRGQIARGELSSGQKAPSITTLAQEYGIARETAQRALVELADEGLLARVPGLGYYVV